MNELQTLIINASNRVLTELGVGHNERIYHKALVHELGCLGFNIDTEMHIVVKYVDSKNHCHHLESLRVDIFIHTYNIILELKAISKKIQEQEKIQIKKYFNILNKEKREVKYGIIINFPQTQAKSDVEYLIVENEANLAIQGHHTQ